MGIGLKILTLIFKGKKQKAQIQKDISQTENGDTEKVSNINELQKNKNEKKKKANKLIKKLNADQESNKKQTKKEELEQAGIDTDVDDVESAINDAVNNDHNNTKQSPFPLNVVSDLSPVHEIQSVKEPSSYISQIQSQGVQSTPLVVKKVFTPTSSIFRTVKAVLPATIHQIHQIASPDDAGTHIQALESNREDIDQ